MSAWLRPLRAALDAAPEPVTIFFRDDDAGWADDRLRPLLDRFAAAGAPLDLAVIPESVEPGLAGELVRRRDVGGTHLGVHQHGFAHLNHEPNGRKCEFGPSRSADDQRRDIEEGRLRLEELLGPGVDPVFTPPWNRCTAETARAVQAAGIEVLSRESRAEPLGVSGVLELPVSVDWMRERDGVRITPAEIGGAIADAVAEGAPVGVMLHHAVMSAADRGLVGELLALLQSSAAVRLATMRQLARTEVPA